MADVALTSAQIKKGSRGRYVDIYKTAIITTYHSVTRYAQFFRIGVHHFFRFWKNSSVG